MSEEARQLSSEHGGTWTEHSKYPLEDWQYEVANDETRLSYWDWVLQKLLEDE